MNTLSVIILTLIIFSAAEDTNIYEWRGKDRSGIYIESNLMKTWPAEGPEEIWLIENLGDGFVSPVFTEKNFYITGEVDSMSILYCFNLRGQKQWQTTLGREWMKSSPGTRCAPTITNKYIYVGTGLGNLYCLDRNSGRMVWSKELIKDFNGSLPLHGHSEAPLVYDNKVYWTPGGKENNVVALNRFTGDMIWSAKGFGERSGYNSPKLIEHAGRAIVVTFSAYHLMGFDAVTGKLLWSQEQDNIPVNNRTPGNGDTHANTVIYENGYVYYAAGDGNGGIKLKLPEDGSSIIQIWRNPRFDSFMGGIVKIGNYLYGCGTATPDFRSVNSETGMITDSLKAGSGSVIAADDMLYYYNHKGELFLMSYNEGKIEKVSSFRITKGTNQHFSHPVINNGILYQRHGNVLIAFDIRKK